MRISELADAVGVPLATVKFYLRERVLMPGVATSRTRAEYDETHVERLRLVRALVESGGLGIREVRDVVGALEQPPASPHELLGVAHRALPPPVQPAAAPAEVVVEVVDRLHDLGWEVCLESPLVGSLARAVADARAAGIPLAAAELTAYAEAARLVARADVAVAAAAPSPAAALHTVVVGTVLVDPVVATLRRLAQVVESAEQLGG